MKTITASKLRVELASIIKDLHAVGVTKHGKVVAILASPKLIDEIAQKQFSTQEIDEGDHLVDWGAVRARFEPYMEPEEPVSMMTTPRAPEPSQSDLDAYNDDHEEDDFDADDWDMSMDSDFENYLNKMMSHAIDRPRP